MQGKLKRIVAVGLILLFVGMQVVSGVAATTYVTLRYGSKGSEVVKLQQALQNKGYYNYTVDGHYGKITEKAVINFQKDSKITIDGIAGPQTQSKLYAANTTVSRGTTLSRAASSEDLYWLARIIHAESSAEPYQGKVAVGSVVLNRVKSSAFPNTVKGVIFEYYNNIPQFSPVADGTIYNTPSAESTKAAQEALSGVQPVGNATYFFNPKKAAGSWIVKNKAYVTTIGDHVFYR